MYWFFHRYYKLNIFTCAVNFIYNFRDTLAPKSWFILYTRIFCTCLLIVLSFFVFEWMFTCCPPRLLSEVQDWNPDSWPSELGFVELARGTPREQDRAKWAGVRWPSGRRIEPRVEVRPELLSSRMKRKTDLVWKIINLNDPLRKKNYFNK